jgi:hypothetical protein
MSTIESSNTIPGAFGQRRANGAPSNGTSEVQTITLGGTPTGGSFKLSFQGQTTAAISWSSTNATLLANVQNALRALGTVGAEGITVAAGTLTAGIGTMTATFGGHLAALALPALVVASNNLSGTSPTIAITKTTPGVTATQRGAPKGALLINTLDGELYQNMGTATAPIWTLTADE